MLLQAPSSQVRGGAQIFQSRSSLPVRPIATARGYAGSSNTCSVSRQSSQLGNVNLRPCLLAAATAPAYASLPQHAGSTTALLSAGLQAAATLPSIVSYAVMASTVYTAVLFLAMIARPRATPVRKLIQSLWVFVPLALTYFALLAYSWTPDTISTIMPGSWAAGFSGGFNPQFFPKLLNIGALFSQPATAASWWLHILAINLFLGRSLYLEGVRQGIPTRHSLLVASVFGPMGLLLHYITKVVLVLVPWLRPDARQQILDAGNGGRIIIMPYDK